MKLSTLPIVPKMQKIWAKMPYQSFRFSGTETKSFLQGQLTQDVNAVNTDNCLYAAYCNPKGRMFANLLLTADELENSINLRLHEAQTASVMARLKMFILRADVTIEALPYSHIAMNLSMANALCDLESVNLPEVFSVVNISVGKLCSLPNGLFELILMDEARLTVILEQLEAVNNEEMIHRLRLQGGHFHVLPATNEVILPQQTPLEPWGGISYTKGCYVGQEIIARNKYLGKVKKGLAFATLASTASIPLCTDVHNSEGKLVGKVLECQMVGEEQLILAVVSLDSLDSACQIEHFNVDFSPVITKI